MKFLLLLIFSLSLHAENSRADCEALMYKWAHISDVNLAIIEDDNAPIDYNILKAYEDEVKGYTNILKVCPKLHKINKDKLHLVIKDRQGSANALAKYLKERDEQ